MKMIPRYRPALELAAWAGVFFERNRHARAEVSALGLFDALGIGQSFPFCIAAGTLRQGLFAWFQTAQSRMLSRRVLMSAQICPAVPRAAIAAGLNVEFVDIAEDCPTPGPRQIAAAFSVHIGCIVLAPLYGHMQTDWRGAGSILFGREIVLDLAQGLGWAVPMELLQRAATIGFSFGIGKGVDTGGGLLASREALLDKPAMGTLSQATLLKCILLRATMAAGLYSLLAGAVERAAEADFRDFKPQVRLLDLAAVASFWRARILAFRADVQRARRRALELGEALGGRPVLAYAAQCFSAEATHLRQVLRLSDPQKRDSVLSALRSHGVDCAPAGETPPWAYLDLDPGRFPNTARFRADAIRLPFLGRLAEGEFTRVRHALEAALG